MAQQTRTATKPAQTPPPAESKGQVAVLTPARLLAPATDVLKRYDIDAEGWRTLTESIFPAAKTVTAVMMALDYCHHRKLDVFKRPVHIVPIWNSQAGADGKGALVETIWPGIAELRTTAMRTKEYAGMDMPVFGPEQTETFKARVKKWENGQQFWANEEETVTFPSWCQITVYRLMGGNRVPFPGPRVYWLETYARKGRFSEIPNEMWCKRQSGQLEKCAEAASLRRAFPEELGNEYAVDEVGAFHTVDAKDVTDQGSATVSAVEPTRADFEKKDSQAAPRDVVSGNEAGQAGASPPAGSGNRTADGVSAGPEAAAQPERSTGKPPHDPKAQQEAERAEQLAAAGVTDVDPETGEITERSASKADLDEEAPDAPPVFEDYSKRRIGDFFNDQDPWLETPGRLEAELVAWGAFYKSYLDEKEKHGNQAIREAIADTKKLWQEALKRASKR